ncbi:acid-sensing ion channel 1C-like [Haliotis asinina]|uniref:acid-sensing ion channel 1C-like n=1 Tax=Haliotis asinina TaxID=109174 RepID=UPI0035321DA6
MVGSLTFILVTAVLEFNTYPTMTKYSVEVKKALKFPTVTICNFSPISSISLKAQNVQDIDNFLLSLSPMYGQSTTVDWTADPFYQTEMTKEWYESVAEKEPFLNRCFFGGVDLYPCNHSVVTNVHTKTGLCYQYNSNSSQPITTSETGSTMNLALVLVPNQQYYTFTQDPAAGVRPITTSETGSTMNLALVLVPNQQYYTFTQDPAAGVRPITTSETGSTMNLALVLVPNQQYYTFTQDPAAGVRPITTSETGSTMNLALVLVPNQQYYTFTQDPAAGVRPITTSETGSTMNLALVLVPNQQYYTFTQDPAAGVRPITTSETGSIMNLALVLVSNQQYYTFTQDPAAGVRIKIHDQHIHPDDVSSEIIAGVGTSNYIQLSKIEVTSVGGGETMHSRVIGHLLYCLRTQNALELRIFYEDLIVEKFEQLPQYSITDLLAGIGGYMGLFLGASILTLTEMGEFAVLSIANCYKKKSLKKDEVVTLKEY